MKRCPSCGRRVNRLTVHLWMVHQERVIAWLGKKP
jgi:hypothetical protein